MKYKNLARIEQEDREFLEEDAAYRKQFGQGQEQEEDETPGGVKAKEPETPEEKTWAERYSNLRSHSDKKINEKEKELRDLRLEMEALKRKSSDLPENIEEAREWISSYPDLGRILKTIVREETKYVEEGVSALREDVEAERFRLEKEKAFQTVVRAHADFPDLINDPDFQEWVQSQPEERGRIGQGIYDALMNDIDPRAAIKAVDLYKSDKKKNKPSETSREVVQKVTRTSVQEPRESRSGRIFKESEIEAMNIQTYERLEDAIEEARLEGRIEYDLSGAAR